MTCDVSPVAMFLVLFLHFGETQTFMWLLDWYILPVKKIILYFSVGSF